MMHLAFALTWLIVGLAAIGSTAQGTRSQNVTVREYLFAETTLVKFRKQVEEFGVKDQALKTHLAAGSGLAGVYAKVKRVGDEIVEIHLSYSTIWSARLQPLRHAPFRDGDQDFPRLKVAIPD